MRSHPPYVERSPSLSRERQLSALSSVGVEDCWHGTLGIRGDPTGHKEDHRDGEERVGSVDPRPTVLQCVFRSYAE